MPAEMSSMSMILWTLFLRKPRLQEKIFDCIQALKTVEVQAPVHIGDIILKNVAGLGVDLVATKNVESR